MRGDNSCMNSPTSAKLSRLAFLARDPQWRTWMASNPRV